MIQALLITLVAGQTYLPDLAIQPDPQPRPRIFRSDGPPRLGRIPADNFAFFEAFPLGGTGAGAVAPLPNWLLQSDAIDTGSWFLQQTGTAITVTGAGFGTMERLQIPATTAGQYALVYQPTAVVIWPIGTPLTCALDVRGNGMSGTIDVEPYNGAIFNSTPCAFTNGVTTRCIASAVMATNATLQLNIGNDTLDNGGNARPANDVFVGRVMCNVGSTAAPYVATTTAPKGYTPTGAKGETLTFTRASTAMATKTAGGGLATTGIQNGDLVLMPNDQPRVEYDGAGTLGLLVESSRTNSALRSQEIDNVAWINENTVVAAPTLVGADTVVAPDGTTTAESYSFPATAAGQDSARAQLAACPVATDTLSVYVKGVGMSGTTDICINRTSGVSVICGDCVFVSSSWSRCSLPGAVVASGGAAFIGNMTLYNGAVARSTNTVAVWGAQCEAGAYTTSYIPTTAAAATRAAEDAKFVLPSMTVTAPWSAAATTTLPGAIPSNARVGGVLGPTGLATEAYDLYAAGTLQVFSTQFTPNNYSTTGAISTGIARYAAYHDGTNANGCVNSVCSAGVARAWTPLASVTTLQVGEYSTANGVIDGIQSRICFQNDSATRCR